MNQPIKNPPQQPMGENTQPRNGQYPTGQNMHPPMNQAAGRPPMNNPMNRPQQGMRPPMQQQMSGQGAYRPQQGGNPRMNPMGNHHPQQGVNPAMRQPTHDGYQQQIQRQPYPQQQQSAQIPRETHAQGINNSHVNSDKNTSTYFPNFASDFGLPATIITTKGFMLVSLIVLIIGMMFGSLLFGGGSSPQPQRQGLQGVVRNQDMTTPLRRCGMIDRGEACVLYIMNSTRYDKVAEDFFDEAVKLTEIQKYSISMVNPKYSKTRIPPGYFAEIKIPKIR
ncbi:MAG: hypothetical protein IJO11_03865 [Alphaproteobacteria bacterium]|nr:hypothetical protein [Alphaproteobacteria bacterium]